MVSRLAYVYLCATDGVRHEWPAASRVLDLAQYGLAGWWRERKALRVPAMAAEPIRSPPVLALVAAALGLIGTQAIDGAIQVQLDRPIVAPQALITLAELVGAAILFVGVAPLLETLAMAVLLEPMRRWFARWRCLAATSAVIWGAWHAFVNHPLQFFSMTWLFWVLSRLYLGLRRQGGVVRAMGWTCVAHALNNLIALGLIVARQAAA